MINFHKLKLMSLGMTLVIAGTFGIGFLAFWVGNIILATVIYAVLGLIAFTCSVLLWALAKHLEPTDAMVEQAMDMMNMLMSGGFDGSRK